jgi:hypothetical protein
MSPPADVLVEQHRKMAEPGSGQKATSKDCMCDGAIGRGERNHSME